MKDKPLLLIDASAMKKSHCGLRLYYTVHTGYSMPVVNNDITFGSAFHAYRKVYEETGDSKIATTIASEYYEKTPCFVKKNKQHLTDKYLKKTILEYMLHWQGREDWRTLRNPQNIPLVELKFSLPYYVDDEIEILLCGTMDRIARNVNNPGMYAVMDYKTTHVWNIPTYLESYRLSPQLMFYVYILKQLAKVETDIEGLPLSNNLAKEITSGTLGAIIDGIFLGGDRKETQFQRSDFFIFDDETLSEFEIGLREKIMKLAEHVKNGTKPYREGMVNGTCEGIFGACEYAIGCGAPSMDVGNAILNNTYVKREYNPMEFN